MLENAKKAKLAADNFVENVTNLIAKDYDEGSKGGRDRGQSREKYYGLTTRQQKQEFGM